MSPTRVNALCIRAGALGDLILLRPALAALRAAGWHTTLLAPAGPAAALLGTGPGDADDVWRWDAPECAALVAGEPTAQLETRLGTFDAALAWSASEPLAAALRGGIPRVVAMRPQPDPGFHAAAWCCRALADLGVPIDPTRTLPPPAPPDDVLDPDAARTLRLLGPSFIALHPGSGSPTKNWPGFAALRDVLPAAQERVLVVAGPADEAAVAPLRGHPRVVLAEGLALRPLGALLAHARCYVGNDSGVTHLAAAWGAPTVALFGPTDADTWRPLGRRVEVLRAPGGDLHAIAVADVVAAVARLSMPSSHA